MKKIVSSLCTFAIVLVALVSGVSIAYASSFEEESDLVFRKAMEEILSQEAVSAEIIKVVKEPVYDLSLEQLGFIYNLLYDGKEGYALVINTSGAFDVTEFYLEAESPYKGYDGQKIYASVLSHLVFQNDCFIETVTGQEVDSSIILAMKEKAFSAGAAMTTGFETIYYTNRVENKFELTKRHPAYYPVGENISNACVPAAGANVIGFWTRYYPELMPGFTPGSIQFGQYLYKETTVEADALVATLFYAMGTNNVAPGTTIEEFRTGMNSYVNGKGRSISYNSCIVSGSFNYSLTKQRLEAGLPLVLFIDCFRVDEFMNGTDTVYLNYLISESCHAMAGFGYNEITYTLSNGTTRNDTYIQVATGLVTKSKGYFNINYNTQIDECYAITIS